MYLQYTNVYLTLNKHNVYPSFTLNCVFSDIPSSEAFWIQPTVPGMFLALLAGALYLAKSVAYILPVLPSCAAFPSVIILAKIESCASC